MDRISLIVGGELTFSSPTEDTNWDRIYEAGCDVPSAVRLANKLRENGIEIDSDVCPYTLQALIDTLKG